MPAQTIEELTEEELLKKAPKIDGIELERVIRPRDFEETKGDVQIFIPFSPESDYKPAEEHKSAVEKIVKSGVQEDYKLLASIRQLAEHYKATTVMDLHRYEHEGVDDAIAKVTQPLEEKLYAELKTLKDDKEKEAKVKEYEPALQKIRQDTAQKLMEENHEKYKQDIATAVKNADAAWAESKIPAVVTPPHNFLAHEDARYLLPDEQSVFLQNAGVMQKFIDANGSRTDLKNYTAGKRFYVTKYKKVKNDKDEDVSVIDSIEVWKKKED